MTCWHVSSACKFLEWCGWILQVAPLVPHLDGWNVMHLKHIYIYIYMHAHTYMALTYIGWLDANWEYNTRKDDVEFKKSNDPASQRIEWEWSEMLCGYLLHSPIFFLFKIFYSINNFPLPYWQLPNQTVPAKPLHHNFKEKDVQKSQIWKQMAVLIHLQPKNSKKKKSC